jgi:hypothetical protein
MALVIDKSSATITADKTGAKTAIEVGTDFALLHCTRNVRVGLVNSPGQTDPTNGPGIRLTGKVLISGNPASNDDKLAISNFKFAIIQVSTVLVYELKYSGRMANEGSMVADIRAGFSPNPCFDGRSLGLDSAFADSVNTVTPVQGPKPGFQVTSIHDDGPFTFALLRFENARVRAPNFLYSARRDEGFVSYLVAREPNGTTHFLSHIGWHVIWHGEFQWVSAAQKPQVVMRTSSFDVGVPVLGEPRTADASFTMAKQPVGQTSNQLDKAAFAAGFVARNSSILTQATTRPTDLPGKFF